MTRPVYLYYIFEIENRKQDDLECLWLPWNKDRDYYFLIVSFFEGTIAILSFHNDLFPRDSNMKLHKKRRKIKKRTNGRKKNGIITRSRGTIMAVRFSVNLFRNDLVRLPIIPHTIPLYLSCTRGISCLLKKR